VRPTPREGESERVRGLERPQLSPWLLRLFHWQSRAPRRDSHRISAPARRRHSIRVKAPQAQAVRGALWRSIMIHHQVSISGACPAALRQRSVSFRGCDSELRVSHSGSVTSESPVTIWPELRHAEPRLGPAGPGRGPGPAGRPRTRTWDRRRGRRRAQPAAQELWLTLSDRISLGSPYPARRRQTRATESRFPIAGSTGMMMM
jgi:hypothetical protein